eukprot:182259-Pelagomonas_calceolata.AAC.2
MLLLISGTPVKPFFDDAAADDHSVKLYGHVTISQFRQCISTKLDLHLTDHEAAVVVDKFRHEDKPELGSSSSGWRPLCWFLNRILVTPAPFQGSISTEVHQVDRGKANQPSHMPLVGLAYNSFGAIVPQAKECRSHGASLKCTVSYQNGYRSASEPH